jgi:hypothetical protein
VPSAGRPAAKPGAAQQSLELANTA